MTGKFDLSRGDIIEMAIGQRPRENHWAGCGATFVAKYVGQHAVPLVIAGGGGGFIDGPTDERDSCAKDSSK